MINLLKTMQLKNAGATKTKALGTFNVQVFPDEVRIKKRLREPVKIVSEDCVGEAESESGSGSSFLQSGGKSKIHENHAESQEEGPQDQGAEQREEAYMQIHPLYWQYLGWDPPPIGQDMTLRREFSTSRPIESFSKSHKKRFRKYPSQV